MSYLIATWCVIFSKIDLRSGYHQVRIHPMTLTRRHSIPDTVIMIPRTPFGLTNATGDVHVFDELSVRRLPGCLRRGVLDEC